jgi:hypothetical protein
VFNNRKKLRLLFAAIGVVVLLAMSAIYLSFLHECPLDVHQKLGLLLIIARAKAVVLSSIIWAPWLLVRTMGGIEEQSRHLPFTLLTA